MATITIQIDQSTKPPGTPGTSRDDLSTGLLCTGTDPANGAGAYSWILVVPPGSSATLSGAGTATCTWTPDVEGTYLLFLDFDAEKSYTLDSDGNRISSQGGAGVKFANGSRAPGTGESNQFDTTHGWANDQHSFMAEVDRIRAALDLTEGSMLYADASGELATLAVGTSGYLLRTNGAASAPSWVAASTFSAPPGSGAGGAVTLDDAYDGGPVITADAGAVTISSTIANNDNVLELTKNPGGTFAGSALAIVMGATATGEGASVTWDAIGVGENVGALLVNNTDAAAGAQQYSPGITLGGSGWKTAATAGPQDARALLQVQPQQGVNFAGVRLNILGSIDGGGYVSVFDAEYNEGITARVTVGAADAALTGSANLDFRTASRFAFISLDNATSTFHIQPTNDANGITFGGALGTWSTTALTVTTPLIVEDDTDAETILGRAKIGSPSANVAYFAHYDNLNLTDYALFQSEGGTVTLNSKFGTALNFYNNGSGGSGFQLLSGILSPAITGNVDLGSTTLPWGDLYLSGQGLTTDGTAAAPGWAFDGASDMGVYRNGTALSFSSGGNIKFSMDTALISVGASTIPFAVGTGSETTPALRSTTDADTGQFFDVIGEMAHTCAGTEVQRWHLASGNPTTSIFRNSIGGTSHDASSVGLQVDNATAATGGTTLQDSPVLSLAGKVWDGAVSEDVRFGVQTQVAQRALPAVGGEFHILNRQEAAINWSSIWSITESGAVAMTGDLSLGNNSIADVAGLTPNTDYTSVLGSSSLRWDQFYVGEIIHDQEAKTTGSPTAFTLTGAAHTTLTAGTEASDVVFDLSRTVQFSTGSITLQRAVVFDNPTYAAVAASVITTAASVYITDAPVAGTFVTITNPYALFVDAGVSRFDGDGTNVFELPADATDPTGGGGAATGRIPVKIGGSTVYIPYY